MTDQAQADMKEIEERVKMALAEAGYPNADTYVYADQVSVPCSVPIDVAWRAWQLAGQRTRCLECCRAAPYGDERCLDMSPGSKDCGADRSEW